MKHKTAEEYLRAELRRDAGRQQAPNGTDEPPRLIDHMDESMHQRELWIDATLTPAQAEIIRDAMERGESLTAHAFLAGYFACLDVLRVPSGLREDKL